MAMAFWQVFIFLIGFVHSIVLVNCQHVRLPTLNIKRDQITLSGFSSGGGMAQQVQFSYSSLFSGIAIFSQTYYRCGGGGGLRFFDTVCTKLYNATQDQLYDPNLALLDIDNYAQRNLIENPHNLRHTKLYLYAGVNSSLFTAEMSLNILKIYEPFITDPMNIKTRVQNAELLLPSNNFGAKCSENARRNYFIGNCGLSGPLEALQFLLGPSIVAPSAHELLTLQPLLTFDQTEFFTQERHYVNNLGFIYIPTACTQNATCYLHFYFHGCSAGIDFVGANHVIYSGFLELAEVNNIIVVFPQNLRSNDRDLDDLGCWDTYGYTGRNHATQRGSQIRIVKAMLERLLGQKIAPRYHNKQFYDPQDFYAIEEVTSDQITTLSPHKPDHFYLLSGGQSRQNGHVTSYVPRNHMTSQNLYVSQRPTFWTQSPLYDLSK